MLAAAVEPIEARAEVSARESRAAVRAAIEERYTLPAESQPAAPAG